MQKVVTAVEMREIDRLSTEKYGIPSLTLMENAALASATVIENKLGGSVNGRSFLIFCGKGNNGGDGAALARILSEANASVYVVLLGKVDELEGDALTNFNFLRVYNDNVEAADEDRKLIFFSCDNPEILQKTILNRYANLETCDVIVDAILGTGVDRPLKGLFLKAVQIINKLHADKRCKLLISLDLPSGLQADKADIPENSVNADITATFTAPKVANVLPPASRNNGELVIAEIGSPQSLIDDSPSKLYLSERSDAQKWLQDTRLKAGSYKKNRGHVLLGVGSRNYAGAAVLSANAAVASGAGLVTAAIPESIQASFSERVMPEAMSLPLDETEKGAISVYAAEKFLEFSKKVTVAAVGCGLSSNEETTRRFVREAVQSRKTPVILDADGLNSLSPWTLRGSDELPLILTPHKGEMRRLIGQENTLAEFDWPGVARDFAIEHHVILVLKGERSLIAEPRGRVVINPTGNQGLSKGGNGDTLTGIIAGFLAQTYAGLEENISSSAKMEKTVDAVGAALYIAGMAADRAAETYGMRTMTPSNVTECLGKVIRELDA